MNVTSQDVMQEEGMNETVINDNNESGEKERNETFVELVISKSSASDLIKVHQLTFFTHLNSLFNGLGSTAF